MATFEEQIEAQQQRIITDKKKCLNKESQRIYQFIMFECAKDKKSFTFQDLHWFNKYSKCGITYFTPDDYKYLGDKLVALSQGNLRYKLYRGGLWGLLQPFIIVKRN